MLNKLKQFWKRNFISDFPHHPGCFDCDLPSCEGCRVGKPSEVTKGGSKLEIKNKPIHDLDKKARAVLINGRPFVKITTLGEWMGFRWGKAEVSVQTGSKYYSEIVWMTRLYTKTDAWILGIDWAVEILRNLNAALDEKLREQEMRRIKVQERVARAAAKLSATQKFYGNLTLKELAN